MRIFHRNETLTLHQAIKDAVQGCCDDISLAEVRSHTCRLLTFPLSRLNEVPVA